MKRLSLVLLVVASTIFAQVPAPDFDISVPFVSQQMIGFLLQVQGPPNTPFTVFYVIGNIFYDPNPQIGMLYSGTTSPGGVHVMQLPFQSPVQVTLTEAQLAAVFTPPAAPPIVTEIIALGLVGGGPPPPPPCGPAIGALTYDPNGCIVAAVVKVCPGDVVEVKKNGAVIGSANGPASGQVVIGLGGQCLGPGDVLTATVNGLPFLGPIRG
jgi:hypothetical protein